MSVLLYYMSYNVYNIECRLKYDLIHIQCPLVIIIMYLSNWSVHYQNVFFYLQETIQL